VSHPTEGFCATPSPTRCEPTSRSSSPLRRRGIARAGRAVPVVDVVDQVRFTGTAIRFIHVEIYRDNDPRKGENQWVREWHIPSEPWTFLVGRDGRIKEKFEGAVSSRELEVAVRHLLQ
jgi:hypothetical protein